MNIFEIILVVMGIWFIIFSFIVSTENIKSAIIYQVIPFICGCYCVFFALMTSQIITINV